MPSQRRCAFGCLYNPDTPLHRFPNYIKFPDRFKVWVSLVGGRLETDFDYASYKNKLICDVHFKTEHKNRFKRLSASAVPTLHLTITGEEDDTADLPASTSNEPETGAATSAHPVGTKQTLYNRAFRQLPRQYHNTLGSRIWARYCYPDLEWESVDFQKQLFSGHKMLCQYHFKETDFTDYSAKKLNRYSAPSDPEVHASTNVDSVSGDAFEEDPLESEDSFEEHLVTADAGGEEQEHSKTVDEATDDDVVTEPCPSPEVVEREPQKVVPVICGKCFQLLEGHLFVCASCVEYEPLCASCAGHEAAHAACYVLRANVTRPKSEIRSVLCAIRSELAMRSFADDLDDEPDEIKSEVDMLEDMDPFDEIDSAVSMNQALTTSAASGDERGNATRNEDDMEQDDGPISAGTEDEGDDGNIKSPSPLTTSTNIMKETCGIQQTRVYKVPSATSSSRKPNIIKIIQHNKSKPILHGSPFTPRVSAPIKTDVTPIIRPVAPHIRTFDGSTILKRYQYQEANQHSGIKKVKLIIPQRRPQLTVPQGDKTSTPQIPICFKMPSQAQLLSKPRDIDITKSVNVTQKDSLMQQKGLQLQNQPNRGQILLQKILAQSNNAPEIEQTVTDSVNDVHVPFGSIITSLQKEPRVVLENLNLPANLKKVKIIAFKSNKTP